MTGGTLGEPERSNVTMTIHSSAKILVDCHGHQWMRSQSVESSGTIVDFRFPDVQEHGADPQLALFLDYSCFLNSYRRFSKCRRIAVLTEPNASAPFVSNPQLQKRFEFVLTHDARLLERGMPFIELPFGTTWIDSVLNQSGSFAKTNLVSMIGARHDNPQRGHVLRNHVLDLMLTRDDIDVFGKGISWIPSKVDGLANYAFSIAMENCCQNFYFTEKLVDCLLTDTVPIYYGCEGIGRYFDVRGLLQFQSVEELEMILSQLTWAKYEAMLPFVRANREKAFKERWVTWAQLFQRIATCLIDHYSATLTVARPTLFGIVQDLYRSIRKVRQSVRK